MFFFEIIGAIFILALVVAIINNSYARAVKKAQEHIISSLHEATIVIDAHKKIIFFNKAAETLTTVSPKNAIGQPIDSVLQLFENETAMLFANYSELADSTKSQGYTFT